VIHSARGWGKTKQAREAYEAAVARGEHAHYGHECSIDCDRINLIRYPRPNRLGLLEQQIVSSDNKLPDTSSENISPPG
jgi:hypothetical protein